MKLFLIIIFALIGSFHVFAAQQWISKPERVDLIELFTSEGCSSCPPAERRMNAYADHKGLWSDFVPVAFHVDYWNYLGWTDRFSAPEFSARQRSYSKTWRSNRIYTPCFVVNGRPDSGPWRKTSADTPGTLALCVNETEVSISFSPTNPTGNNLIVWIAPLTGNENTEVISGENRGRILEHNFVALGLIHQSLHGNNGRYSASIPLTFTPDIKAVAAWISEENTLKPIQAVGGWLE